MVDLPDSLRARRLPDMPPQFEYVFEMRVVTGYVLSMPYGGNTRLMVEVAGGDVSGPRFQGTILPGGVEWPTYRPDGVGMVDARYTFQSHDGVLVNIHQRGFRRASPEVMAKLNALDEFVDPSEYYIRTTPLFEAPPGPYGWLADHCFVGVGERQKECLFMRYYMVL